MGYCQEQYPHYQQQIDSEKNTKRKDHKHLYIVKKCKDTSYQQEQKYTNSPGRNICTKDRIYMK